ncbi:free fatty acid receptor 3-like isoform 2-T3 [Liasis olivaceus]
MTENFENRNTYISVYLLTILIGFPTNLLALCALIQKIRNKATPNSILLLNLTISDLCFLVFLLFKIAEQIAGRWVFPTFLCPFTGLVYFSTIYSSTLFLTARSCWNFLTRIERICMLPSLIRKLFFRGTEKLGRAGPQEQNVGSFDNNNVGSNSFNDNGNSYDSGSYGGNSRSFDNNKVGDNSFNDNGNSYNGPEIWY